MTTIKDEYADIVSSATTFTDRKVNLTQTVTAYVRAFNVNAPRAELTGLFTAIVSALNATTTASNDLRERIKDMTPKIDGLSVALENLSDLQVEEMKTNPQQYFCAGYMAMVNSLLFYGREQGLVIADMVHTDLMRDINDAFDDQESGTTPDPPRVAIVFSNGHALDLVKKALADVTIAEEPDASAAS